MRRAVVAAVYSEFVLGSGVRGSFHGARPLLSDLDNGDLRYSVDFRDVYASLLEGVLRTDAGPSLGDWPGRVGFVA